ncbi:secretory phospholipase A2 receptor-like [Pecten maximus]|uniref:secretory phospholipase A2 receptor-like n=1 Tax=Pecten maximus TaxID=6579 RepID=UPI0014588AA1|nr:secretory phospholipase A2 receptor-like [Pecten maximus]
MTRQDLLTICFLVLCLGGWTVMSFPGPCDHGWYYRKGICYYFHTEQKTWDDANETCISQNATLVQIKDIELNTYLAVTAATIFNPIRYWIGLKRPEDFEYRNVGENTTIALNWQQGEPNDGPEACVFSENSKMTDSKCIVTNGNDPRGYICQVLSSCADGNLDKNGFQHNDIYNYSSNECLMHYRFAEHVVLNWTQGNENCANIPGRLVHMTSDIESFLNEKMADITTTSFWIAARPYKEDIFYWLDGSVNDMNDTWAPGEPNRLSENCVFVQGNEGSWLDIDCHGNFSFICEKNAYPYDPSLSTTSSNQDSTNAFDCTCRCSRLGKRLIVNMTLEELQFAVAQLKRELAVNKSTLSSVIRRKTSAGDQRQSAAIMGYVGTAIICVVIGLVIITDVPLIVRTVRRFLRKTCFVSRTPKTHPR